MSVARSSQLNIKHSVEHAAEQFEQNLLERHVLFCPTDGSRPYETYFPPECFFHLCGIQYKNRRQRVSAKKFFQLALDRRIDADLFAPKYSTYTAQKLQILPRLVRIDTYAAKMAPMPMVHFGNTRADLILYNQDVILGLRITSATGMVLTPCTALCDRLGHQHDEKNIGFVLKTEPREKTYTIDSKPKGELTDDQHSRRRKSLSKYAGECKPPLGWRV